MENHALDPVIGLKVNISCCKECPKKLEKALLKINGVHQVALNPQKKLVYVSGNVDPLMLLKAIEEMGKNPELVFYEKEPKKVDFNGENHHKHDQTSRDKRRENNKGRDKNCCCHGVDDDDEHNMEGFDHNNKGKHHAKSKEFDEEMFWDSHGNEFHRNRSTNGSGKVHSKAKHHAPSKESDEEMSWDFPPRQFQRSRSTNGRMPYMDSGKMFGNHHDHYSNGHFRGESSRFSQSSRWFREDPPPARAPAPAPAPPPYSYNYQRMPPPRFGSFRERHISQFDKFTHFFSDDNPSSCSIM